MFIEDDWVISDSDIMVNRIPTKNISGDIKPKYISVYGTMYEVDDLIEDFTERGDIKESAHLLVDGNTVYQFAPFTEKTWHAGTSYWQGHHGLNGYSIGIYVTRSPQSAATLHEVIPVIVSEYNIRDIIPGMRPTTIPFDISHYKPYVEYGNADSAGRFISTAKIHIHSGPHVNFDILDSLSNGESVKVLRYSGDGEWAFVLYERSDHIMRYGWTHESFLRRL